MKPHAMLRLLIAICLMFFSHITRAEPFPEGDFNIGKSLVEKQCIACHAERFGGDGSAIYTREHRIVNTSRGLLAQIRNCNTMLDLKWFEDEELHVANYLNKTYYKFDK
jgi:hypothetical protein